MVALNNAEENPFQRNSRRKILLINKAFQGKFFILFCGMVLIGVIILSVSLYYLTSRDLGSSLHSAHLAIRSTNQIIFPVILISSLVYFFITAGVVAMLTLRFSHKIAGPLYHLEKDTEVIGQGDLTVVTRFREKDQVKPLAEALTRMTRELREKMCLIKEPSEQLGELTQQIGFLRKDERFPEELDKLLNGLDNQVNELGQALASFKTS